MTDANPFRTYLYSLRAKLRTGVAREQAHRGALERLLEDVGNVQAVNEPSHIECGAPDFIVLRGSVPLGYVEAKDIDHSLDAAARTDQLKRYRESLSNLILTDYLEFRWYVEGEERNWWPCTSWSRPRWTTSSPPFPSKAPTRWRRCGTCRRLPMSSKTSEV